MDFRVLRANISKLERYDFATEVKDLSLELCLEQTLVMTL